MIRVGGMELMREMLEVRRKSACLSPESLDPLAALDGILRNEAAQLLKLDGQYCKPLINVVMQFPGNAGPFLLLRIDQTSAQFLDGLLVPLAFRDVMMGDHYPTPRYFQRSHGHQQPEQLVRFLPSDGHTPLRNSLVFHRTPPAFPPALMFLDRLFLFLLPQISK